MRTKDALELIGDFTAGQWGMVTSGQALGVGVDNATLHRLMRDGHLDRVRHGVYASTTATGTAAREQQAAWLSLNPTQPLWDRPPLDPDGGVLSHQSAANLHNLGDLFNDRIAFTTPRRRTSRDSDLWFKMDALGENDVTLVDSLPVTTPLRTICDLLDQGRDGGHVATIIREAVVANLVQLDELIEAIGPYTRRYAIRRPGDGLRLLEHLLSQIGTSPAELAHRPAPAQVLGALAKVLADQRTLVDNSGVVEGLLHVSKSSQLISDAMTDKYANNIGKGLQVLTDFLAQVGSVDKLAALGSVDKFAALGSVDKLAELGAVDKLAAINDHIVNALGGMDTSAHGKFLDALEVGSAARQLALEPVAQQAARHQAELLGQDGRHDRNPEDATKLRGGTKKPRAERGGEEGRPHIR